MAAALSLTKSPKRSGTGTATVLSDGGGGVRGCGGTTWAVPVTDTSSRARSPRAKGSRNLRMNHLWPWSGEPTAGRRIAHTASAEPPARRRRVHGDRRERGEVLRN